MLLIRNVSLRHEIDVPIWGISVIGLTTDLLINPAEFAGLIDSGLECLSAKLGDFGRCDAHSDPAMRQFKERRLLRFPICDRIVRRGPRYSDLPIH
jgi:hypothetical protein